MLKDAHQPPPGVRTQIPVGFSGYFVTPGRGTYSSRLSTVFLTLGRGHRYEVYLYSPGHCYNKEGTTMVRYSKERIFSGQGMRGRKSALEEPERSSPQARHPGTTRVGTLLSKVLTPPQTKGKGIVRTGRNIGGFKLDYYNHYVTHFTEESILSFCEYWGKRKGVCVCVCVLCEHNPLPSVGYMSTLPYPMCM